MPAWVWELKCRIQACFICSVAIVGKTADLIDSASVGHRGKGCEIRCCKNFYIVKMKDLWVLKGTQTDVDLNSVDI